MINICTKFEFNPSTSWGSYARHRHHLLHGARSTTDIKPWHKHTTGELTNEISITKFMVLIQNVKMTVGPLWNTGGTETEISVPVSVLGPQQTGTKMGGDP